MILGTRNCLTSPCVNNYILSKSELKSFGPNHKGLTLNFSFFATFFAILCNIFCYSFCPKVLLHNNIIMSISMYHEQF